MVFESLQICLKQLNESNIEPAEQSLSKNNVRKPLQWEYHNKLQRKSESSILLIVGNAKNSSQTTSRNNRGKRRNITRRLMIGANASNRYRLQSS